SRKSLPKSGWVMVKVTQSTGSPRSNQARCSTKWKGSAKSWRARRSAWTLPSCRSRPGSSRVISVLKEYTMKASELRSKDAAELTTELDSLLKAQFGLRMQKATQQHGNTTQLRNVRRDIARVRTLLTEKAGK